MVVGSGTPKKTERQSECFANSLIFWCLLPHPVHSHLLGFHDFPPCLFHDKIIFYGFYPFDTSYDLTRLINGPLKINEAAQFHFHYRLLHHDTSRQ
jgi:hypothetical protein